MPDTGKYSHLINFDGTMFVKVGGDSNLKLFSSVKYLLI